jgi:hypothetical protein
LTFGRFKMRQERGGGLGEVYNLISTLGCYFQLPRESFL